MTLFRKKLCLTGDWPFNNTASTAFILFNFTFQKYLHYMTLYRKKVCRTGDWLLNNTASTAFIIFNFTFQKF